MAKNPTLNPTTQEPTNLSQVTKDFMLAFIKVKGTTDDRNWYKNLCHNNVITKKNPLTGGTMETINYKVVREAFCQKFFPNLLNRSPSKGKTYLDQVNEL